jgi:hypothetical protein
LPGLGLESDLGSGSTRTACPFSGATSVKPRIGCNTGPEATRPLKNGSLVLPLIHRPPPSLNEGPQLRWGDLEPVSRLSAKQLSGGFRSNLPVGRAPYSRSLATILQPPESGHQFAEAGIATMLDTA